MQDGAEVQPSARRADLGSSIGSGGVKAGEGEEQQQQQHPGLKHATSWRDNLSFSNPKLWIFLGVMFALGITSYIFGKQAFAMITAAKDWFRAGSPWTIVFYLAFMAVWCVVLMPYGPLCIAVGFIFGFYQGLCIQLIALLVSNAALYGVGRHLLRDHVEKLMSQHRIWKGLTRMLATDWQEAAKINVLLCFMPIPYGSHGYLFALSDVPFFQFVGVFALGMLPNTCLNLLVGEAMSEATDKDGITTYNMIGLVLAIGALVAAVCHASTVAQRVLDEAEAPTPPSTGRSERDPLVSQGTGAQNNV